MSLAKTIFKWLLRLLALVLLICLAVLIHAEWSYRHPPPTQTPSSFETSGPAGAPVLILLHGAGLNGHMWDGVKRHLDPRWRVIALDLPGHGSRSREQFSLEGATETIAAALRSVAPAPVILVGDSLGGYSAMAAAASLPQDQLRGLMLSGSSANFTKDQILPVMGNVLMVEAILAVKDEQALVPTLLSRFGLAEQDQAAIRAAGVSMRAVLPSGRALMFVDIRAKLAAIPQPVLIVNGSLDARAVAQEDSFVAAAQKPSRYRFENCEHGVSMRRPEEFAQQLNAFAAQVMP